MKYHNCNKFQLHQKFQYQDPKSKNTGRFQQEDTRNRRNMEAVFPSENFRIFPDDFQPISRRKAQKIGWNPPEKNP